MSRAIPPALWRSPLAPSLDLGRARLVPLGDAEIVADFGDVAAEARHAAALGLADLSPLPRAGFKGPGALSWLRGLGYSIGPEPNRAYVQADGSAVVLLSAAEALVLDALDRRSELLREAAEVWSLDDGPGCYHVDRRNTHAWLALCGAAAPEVMAKLCAVDLRPAAFGEGSVAQTSAARTAVILIRGWSATSLRFDILVDSASAEYLWGCLLDAMAEFDGAAVGLDSLVGRIHAR